MKKYLAIILFTITLIILLVLTNNAKADEGAYRSYEEMKTELQEIEISHPHIAKVYNLSKEYDAPLTWQNRTIWAIKISDNVEIDEDEPEVLYMALHHSREWITVEVTLYFLNHLIDNYETNPQVTWLVNNREIWIVPIVNPDGYEYSINRDDNAPGKLGWQQWRKNCRDNDGNGIFETGDYENGEGVDLNRNYPVKWGTVGTTHNSNDRLYCGPYDDNDDDKDGKIDEDPDGGFSEPETQNIKALVENRNFIISLSYHSYGEWWLRPWGDTMEEPKDHDIFVSIGDNCSRMNGYWSVQGPELYPTTGGSDDWLYGVHGIYAFTPELGNRDDGFIPSDDRIIPICLENLGPNLYIAEVAGNPRQNSPKIIHSPHNDTIESKIPYEIKAQIKSEIGIDEVNLYYKNDKDGSFISTPMIKNSEHEYSTNIPSQDISTKIFYYILVIDQNGNVSTSPKFTPYASHNFTVIEKDTENPKIIFKTRTDIDFNNEKKEYTITALFSDNVGLNSKKLYYHYNESSDFISKDFSYIMNNQYKAIVKGAYRDLLHYYIEINDTSGNSFREPKNGVYIYEMCFFDNFEIENLDWQSGGNNDLWHLTEFDSHNSKFSWFNSYENSHIYEEYMNNYLFSKKIELPTNFTSILSFWHRYETEYFFDGGIVEINNGSDWEQIFPINGYNEEALYSLNPLGPVPGYSKSSALPYTGSKTGWVRALFDITDYGGEEIQIRFHFGSDGGKNNTGWFIDDVSIFGYSIYNISLICENNESIVSRGKSIKYEIIIKNEGDVKDTISIKASNPPHGWEIELENDPVTLESDESTQINLTVFAPYYGIADDFAVINVTANSSGNPNINNTITTITTIDKTYEILLECKNTNKKVKVSESISYIITVTNNGSIEDTFKLYTSNPINDGWETEIKLNNSFVNNVTLEPFESVEITLVVTSPKDVFADDYDEISFIGESENMSTISASILTKTTIKKSYGVELECNDKKKNIQPGEFATYNLEIKNTGNIQDNFEIKALDLPENWEIELNDVSDNRIFIDLEAFESKSITVRILSYDDSKPCEKYINITVTSQGNISKKDTITLTAIVTQIHDFYLQSASTTKYVSPGEPAIFLIDLINNGNGKEEIELSINISTLSPAYWSVKFENDMEFFSINVKEFDKKTIVFMVNTYENETADIESLITIDAKSDNYSVSKALKVIINQVYNIELSCKYNQKEVDPGDSASYTILVKNLGNGEEIISLSTSESKNGWEIFFNQESSKLKVKLEAKESKTITLTVKTPEWDKYESVSSIIVYGESDEGTYSNITIITFVNFILEINLTVEPASQEIEALKTVTYIIKITNDGNCKTTIILEYSSVPKDWTVEIDLLMFDIEKGEIFEVFLKVSAPRASKDGNKANVIVIATSGYKSWSIETNTTVLTKETTEEGMNLLVPVLLLILIVAFIPALLFFKGRSSDDYERFEDYEQKDVAKIDSLSEESIEDIEPKITSGKDSKVKETKDLKTEIETLQKQEEMQIELKEDRNIENKEEISIQKDVGKSSTIEKIIRGRCPYCGRIIFKTSQNKGMIKCIWCGTKIKI